MPDETKQTGDVGEIEAQDYHEGGNQLDYLTFDQDGVDQYLLFFINGECYGAPLLSVREIVEAKTCKPVPNTVACFKGVINIRGQIIGIIDLRIRFSEESGDKPCRAVLLFETPGGTLGAMVDYVEAVVSIKEENIEKKPNIVSVVPQEHFMGIAKHQGQLISLIALGSILHDEELLKISNKIPA